MRYFTLLLALFLGWQNASVAAPIRLHSENSRYFQWDGEPTILITSGEHYGALLNSAFDFDRYFAELASHRLNHTRVFSGVYREVPGDFGITENPLAPQPGFFVCPWARSGIPGESDGGNKFDLTQWDPAYFERLHQLMAAAKERGIVVEFTLFCPMYRDSMWEACPMHARNNVNAIGDCPRDEVYALKHETLTKVQLGFVAKVVTELRQYDNLYFEVCNEPYFGGVTDAWQRRIIDAIVAAESGIPESERHLISLNIANGRKEVIDPPPAVSIFNFHYCVPPDVVAMNPGLNKVIGENETGFRGAADVLYRTEAWDFLLAGGALFNNLDYSFTASHPGGTLRDYTSPGGGSWELRQHLRILRETLDASDFTRMTPEPDALRRLEPASLSHQLLADPGHSYVASFHVPIPEKPKTLDGLFDETLEAKFAIELPAKTYTAEWINPQTGLIERSQTIDHQGGEAQLESPGFVEDIALRLDAVPPPLDTKFGVVFDGDFQRSADAKNLGWRWVREDPESWRVRAGGLELRAQKGRIWSGNDARNVMLFKPDFGIGEGTAEVSVRLNLPKSIYEQGGLLRYADDDNFVKLIVEHIEGRYYVVMAQEIAGKGKVHAKVPIPAPSARLAIQVTGDEVRGHYWNTRSRAWAEVGKCKMNNASGADFGVSTQDGSDADTRWIRFTDLSVKMSGAKVDI
ncbi:MAG: hypothetical protein KDN22_33190 [Verrucomicrobiae bacterium]|nr:hypothetical protein [Verrucomicrobiae bacterium]